MKKTIVNNGGSTKPSPRNVAVRKGAKERRNQLLDTGESASGLFCGSDFMDDAVGSRWERPDFGKGDRSLAY